MGFCKLKKWTPQKIAKVAESCSLSNQLLSDYENFLKIYFLSIYFAYYLSVPILLGILQIQLSVLNSKRQITETMILLILRFILPEFLYKQLKHTESQLTIQYDEK